MCSKAQLPIVVLAPGPKRAVRLYGQGIASTTGHCSPVALAADLRRGVHIVGAARAELTFPIEAPGPKGSIRTQGQGVVICARNSRPVRGVADLGRRVRVCRTAEAECSVIVVAPGPERTVLLDSQRVACPARDSCPVSRAADPSRAIPVGNAFQAELAIAVTSPGPERTVSPNGHGEAAAAGYIDPRHWRCFDVDHNRVAVCRDRARATTDAKTAVAVLVIAMSTEKACSADSFAVAIFCHRVPTFSRMAIDVAPALARWTLPVRRSAPPKQHSLRP